LVALGKFKFASILFTCALARQASENEKLLAWPKNLLVPDEKEALFSSPDKLKCNQKYPICFVVVNGSCVTTVFHLVLCSGARLSLMERM